MGRLNPKVEYPWAHSDAVDIPMLSLKPGDMFLWWENFVLVLCVEKCEIERGSAARVTMLGHDGKINVTERVVACDFFGVKL